MLAHAYTRGAQRAPVIFLAVFLGKYFMNLQRISEIAENQEGNAIFYHLNGGKAPHYMRKFSPK
jgi:hypothetical protein